ncbi:unnamed protein product [Urochloa decumbens]|uniref:EF-hand domain-containing protein n=1 Tax=Urochloa decumbens TaxID=240449 RepID=A0ABC9E120_9POAL
MAAPGPPPTVHFEALSYISSVLTSLGLDRSEAEEFLDVMNAGKLGELLQEALGTDKLAEDCAAIVECLDGDGAITIEEFRFMADLL